MALITGNNNNDLLTGTAFDDIVTGNGGNDLLFGNDGNDTLIGGAGVDQLTGGNGADIFKFTSLTDSTQSGMDRIADFVKGTDKIDLTGLGFTSITTGTPQPGQLKISYDAYYKQTYVQDLSGSGFAFYLAGNHLDLTCDDFIGLTAPTSTLTVAGTSGANLLQGTSANELLLGLDGVDQLFGNDGNDTLDGGAGADHLTGGNGADIFKFARQTDSTRAMMDRIADFVKGTDKIDVTGLGFTGITTGTPAVGQLKITYDAYYKLTYVRDVVGNGFGSGGTFAFYLNGDHRDLTGDDFIGFVPPTTTITGTDGDDILVGTLGKNIMDGGLGNDTLQGLGGGDVLFGSEGDDTFMVSGNEASSAIIVGGTGQNQLITTGTTDLSNAEITDVQTLTINGGVVTLSSNSYFGLSRINAIGSSATLKGAEGEPASFSTLGLVHSGVINMIGTSAGDFLQGDESAQNINGGGGDDSIWGLGGADILTGGTGADTFNIMNLTDSLLGASKAVRITDFEIGSDHIALPAGFFTGLSTSAVLGQLQIAYNAATDLTSIYDPFGSGFGIYLNGNKTAINGSSFTNFIPALNVIAGSTVGETLTTNGTSGNVVYANDGNDTIIDTSSGCNRLYGEGGNDTFEIAGGYGNTAGLIDGGAGSNTIRTQSGTISYLSHIAIKDIQTLVVSDGVMLSADQFANIGTLVAESGTAAFYASEAGGNFDFSLHSIIGNCNFYGALTVRNIVRLADNGGQAFGGLADDTLTGGEGNDLLVGKSGADKLTGGNGIDTFTFYSRDESTATQMDEITDFVRGADKIDVTGLGFSGLTTGTPASNQLRISYDAASSRTYVKELSGFAFYLDGNHLDLTVDDFIGLPPNTIAGTNANDSLVGTASRDLINGYSGDDTLAGLGGADTLYGDEDNDTFLVNGDEAPAGEVIDGGSGSNTLHATDADISAAQLSNIQNLRVTGTTTFSASQLAALSNISFDGNAALQAANAGTYDFRGKTVSNISDGSSTFISTAGGNNTVYLPTDGLAFYCNSGNNIVYGGAANTFILGSGMNELHGGTGNDLFVINIVAADDPFLLPGQITTQPLAGQILDGGAGGDDTLTFSNTTSANAYVDISQLQLSHITKAFGYRLKLTGAQYNAFSEIYATELILTTPGTYRAFKQGPSGSYDVTVAALTGSDGNDTLIGGSSYFRYSALNGAGGDDLLITPDLIVETTLTGGEGHDIFKFSNLIGSIFTSNKYITDFTKGEDKIDLTGLGFTGITTGTAAPGQLQLTQSGLNTRLADPNGTGLSIYLYGNHLDLTADDIIGLLPGADVVYGTDRSPTTSGNDTLYVGADNLQIVHALSGDDDVYATNPLVGSVFDGGDDTDRLLAAGDLSTSTIMNFETLSVTAAAPVTLTAAQLAQFTAVQGSGTLIAASAGTYDISAKAGLDTQINLSGSASDDILIGNDVGQFLEGGVGDDTLIGGAGSDTLLGGTGNDVMDGGADSDTYSILARGMGQDTILDTDASADPLHADILSTVSGNADAAQPVRHDQLWFSQSGNDLVVEIIGTADNVTMKDWYLGTDHHLGVMAISEYDQTHVLQTYYATDAQMQNLVSAMAGFAKPTGTELTAEQHAALDPILAANWHAAPGHS